MALSTANVRAELISLTDASAAEVKAIFTAMASAPADELRDRLMDELVDLGADYELSAASLAADWYDDLREAASAKRAFTAITADLATPQRWEKLAGWGVGPLYAATPDPVSAMVLIQGGLQRTIANAHRNTIVVSSVADPSARGWARYGVGANCAFCNVLLSRGAVYTEATADFEAHDHCNCIAGPAFS